MAGIALKRLMQPLSIMMPPEVQSKKCDPKKGFNVQNGEVPKMVLSRRHICHLPLSLYFVKNCP